MSNGIQFDPEAIRALAQILKDTDLSEIEVVEKDSRIRVARTIQVAPQFAWPAGFAASASAASSTSADAVDPKHPGLVSSPMVGVVYLAPEPGAAPFVTVGS